MSAEAGDVTGSSAVEQEARGMGWRPLDEFKGDPEKWVEASEFVEKGKHYVPLLRKSNERLEGQVSQLTSELRTLKGDLESSKTSVQELQEFYEEQLVERIALERKQLKADLREARSNEDIDREVEINTSLSKLDAAEQDVKGKLNGKEVIGAPEVPPLEPTFLAWVEQNAWFKVDPERRFEAIQAAERITHEIRMGRMQPLNGTAFYAEVDKSLAKVKEPPGRSKVEGSRGGATRSNGQGRTYSDLPAEAKAACDREAKRFVKPSGLWKTDAEYRKHYVEVLERTGYFTNN